MKEEWGNGHVAIAWECANKWSREVVPAAFSRVTNPGGAGAFCNSAVPIPTLRPTNVSTSAPTLGPTAPPTNKPTNTPTLDCASQKGSTYEKWTGITGASILDLRTGSMEFTKTPNQSSRLTDLLQAPSSNTNEDNYGIHMSGWLVPPVSGDYTFWIASDDNGEFWLSTDANKETWYEDVQCLLRQTL